MSSMKLRNGKILVPIQKPLKSQDNIIMEFEVINVASGIPLDPIISERLSEEYPSESTLKTTIKNLNKKIFENINKFYDVVEKYDKFRKSEEIASLGKKELLDATSKLACEVLFIGKRIITSMQCWLGEKDILKAMIYYYSEKTIEYHVQLLRMTFILDKIREKYAEHDIILHKNAKEVVTNSIDLLKSFGFHILWRK